jgi:hypothetical protein
VLNATYTPFALIHDNTVTKAQVFDRLRNKWKSEIEEIKSAEDQAKHIISSLEEFVAPYRAIVVGEKFHRFGENLWTAISRFYRMPAPSSFYPYGMKLLSAVTKAEVAEKDAEQCLSIIECFLVRRAFLGLEPTGLHAVFKSLWKKAGGDPGSVPDNLETNTIEFPNDERFKERIIEGDLYHRKLRNYVLLEYERSFEKGDPLPEASDISADHVMPQSRQGDWKKTISEDDYNELLHTWANLVPMSGKANSEKGTASWAESQEMYKKGSNFKSTKDVALNNEKWTAIEIRARAEVLSEWALQRWPYSNE